MVMAWTVSFPNAGFSATDGVPRLKVAFASTVRGWHGGEEQLLQLLRKLRDWGHECVVLARRGTECADRIAQQGFPVTHFLGTGYDPWSIGLVRSQLRRWAPDVLHFNDANALTSVGVAAIGLNIPVRVVSRRVDFPIRSSWRYNHLADRVLCVSTAVAGICEDGGIRRESIRVVHDGVDPTRVRAGDRRKGREAVGCRDD